MAWGADIGAKGGVAVEGVEGPDFFEIGIISR